MRKNTWVGWTLFVSAGAFGCGSSNDVNTSGQQGTADASAGNSGSSGSSGSSGTSGNANAGGTGQSGNPNAGGTGQSGNPNAGGTGQSGNPNAGGTGQGGTSGNANAGGAGPIVDGGGVTWGDTQCTDGIDNDGDGKADGADPECTGPLDNDEATYSTGIPGDNRDPKWQDCFFDGNSGAGDDDCRYHTDCLTGGKPQTDPDCTLSQACKDYCQRYTPNGCDCFGCCSVPLPGGGTVNIQINATCTLADAADPTKCPRCTVSTQCGNTCARCELCIGKDTIPADCTPPPGTGGAPSTGGVPNAGGAANGGSPGAGGAGSGGRTGAGGVPATGGATGTGGTPFCPTPLCAPGQQPCGVSCLPGCPSTDFCLTGCCIHAPA